MTIRYRALSSTGDYMFGQSAANFLIDSAYAVGQAILTRLRLMTNEWFLDVTEGTPYSTQIIGKGTRGSYDAAVRTRILGTIGVRSLVSYSSNYNPATRLVTVTATADTVFGNVTVTFSRPQAQRQDLATEGGAIISTEDGAPIVLEV